MNFEWWHCVGWTSSQVPKGSLLFCYVFLCLPGRGIRNLCWCVITLGWPPWSVADFRFELTFSISACYFFPHLLSRRCLNPELGSMSSYPVASALSLLFWSWEMQTSFILQCSQVPLPATETKWWQAKPDRSGWHGANTCVKQELTLQVSGFSPTSKVTWIS